MRVGFSVERSHEHGETEGIRQQDEFLPLVVGNVANVRKELNALEPFVFGQLNVACKCMQAPDDARHDLPEPTIRRLGMACQNELRDTVFVNVSHVVFNVHLL